jgi:hypothetical protein
MLKMKRRITLAELEQSSTGPVWALNSSPSVVGSGNGGDVHIGVPKLNGSKIDPLHVQLTWLPVDLTASIPRDQLLASSEFRKAVRDGLLTLITPEHAAEIEQQDGADEERARLGARKDAIRRTEAARNLTGSKVGEVKMISAFGGDSADDEVVEEKAPAKKSSVTASFKAGMKALAAKSDVETLNSLRVRAMTRAQVAHAQKVFKDKPKTAAHLAKLLDKFKQK